MAKYMSDEYFSQVQAALGQDPKWQESTRAFKTSITFGVTDTAQNFLLSVENGASTIQKVAPGAPAEISIEGNYDSWCKEAKGELNIQSAVLKGQLKFTASRTKGREHKDRLMRPAEIKRDVPKAV